jgi:hypothetical protein
MTLSEVLPKDLEETRKSALKRLACHYLPELKEDMPHKKPKMGARKTDRGGRCQDDGGHKTVEKRPKSPFVDILKLRSLQLHPAVEAHLQQYKTDAYAFLHTEELINHAGDHSADSLGKALVAQYSYTKAFGDQLGKGRIWWLFMMLMWCDMVKLARPDCTGVRIGKLMEISLLELYGASDEMKGLEVDVMATELTVWCKSGYKINIFVAKFGEGCLFYLCQIMSRSL